MSTSDTSVEAHQQYGVQGYCRACTRDWPCKVSRLAADLAAATARAAALAVEIEQMRAALQEISAGAIETLDFTDRCYTNGQVADDVRIEFETHGPARRIREIKAILAQPAGEHGAAIIAVVDASLKMLGPLRLLMIHLHLGGVPDRTMDAFVDLMDTYESWKETLAALCRARAAARGAGSGEARK